MFDPAVVLARAQKFKLQKGQVAKTLDHLRNGAARATNAEALEYVFQSFFGNTYLSDTARLGYLVPEELTNQVLNAVIRRIIFAGERDPFYTPILEPGVKKLQVSPTLHVTMSHDDDDCTKWFPCTIELKEAGKCRLKLSFRSHESCPEIELMGEPNPTECGSLVHTITSRLERYLQALSAEPSTHAYDAMDHLSFHSLRRFIEREDTMPPDKRTYLSGILEQLPYEWLVCQLSNRIRGFAKNMLDHPGLVTKKEPPEKDGFFSFHFVGQGRICMHVAQNSSTFEVKFVDKFNFLGSGKRMGFDSVTIRFEPHDKVQLFVADKEGRKIETTIDMRETETEISKLMGAYRGVYKLHEGGTTIGDLRNKRAYQHDVQVAYGRIVISEPQRDAMINVLETVSRAFAENPYSRKQEPDALQTEYWDNGRSTLVIPPPDSE